VTGKFSILKTLAPIRLHAWSVVWILSQNSSAATTYLLCQCFSNCCSTIQIKVKWFNSLSYWYKLPVCHKWNLSLLAFIIHNRSITFVRRDRSSPMKKNAFIRFITVTHIIMSLYPIIPKSLWMAIWNSLLERWRHMRHGRSLQKSRHEVRFFSDASEQIWIWL